MFIPFPRRLIPAIFIRRVNRFVAEVELEGERERAHVPNTGRMAELLVAGRDVFLLPVSGEHRKTRYDLILVRYGATWVCVDSRQTNYVAGSMLRRLITKGADALPDPDSPLWQRLAGATGLLTEAPYAGHRFDFRLERYDHDVWIEVKSVNLVIDGLALFPDAPTARGTRHLELLREIATRGAQAHVLFIVQRDDATAFAPNAAMDPAFAEALQLAAGQGVAVDALALRMTPEGAELVQALPVCLEDEEGRLSRMRE